MQLGDSHTAADLLTGSLRNQLQQQLGDGGLGWAMPMYISGQRLNKYGYDNTGWKATTSRTEHEGNYTLGGMLATPLYAGATLTIKPKEQARNQHFIVSIRQGENDQPLLLKDATQHQIEITAPIKNQTWQWVEFNATLPFTLTAQQSTQTAIGGWWARNQNTKGAVVSALGINGAELAQWNRWQGWTTEIAKIQPNLIVLEYSTNEAYNNNVNIASSKEILSQAIQNIRRSSPQSSILIISAPESLKSPVGSCGIHPTQLTQFQSMQKTVATEQHTLFWDWQEAMGGNCSMKPWIQQGLARQDGVHFSAIGYQKLGSLLAQNLLALTSDKSDF